MIIVLVLGLALITLGTIGIIVTEAVVWTVLGSLIIIGGGGVVFLWLRSITQP